MKKSKRQIIEKSLKYKPGSVTLPNSQADVISSMTVQYFKFLRQVVWNLYIIAQFDAYIDRLEIKSRFKVIG